MKIPFLKPLITAQDIRAVADVLRSGWLVIGPKTREFEERFASYAGAPHVVATNSCTSSMHLALLALGIGPGDEVITTPLSYVATSNAILHCGARPVFVDVEAHTGLIDPKNIERAITKRTKAILPVHLYGQMADMRAISAIARKHRLAVIEDAAHAIEAQRDGIRPGQKSAGACYSFHVAKNITAGQGGALATHLPRIANHVRFLRRDGIMNVGEKRRMSMLGYKMQITDFQAALLTSQLARISRQHALRVALWGAYAKAFTGVSGIAFPAGHPGSVHASHMFVVWVDPRRRDAIRAGLARAGIETSIHYDPIHHEPHYRKTFGFRKGDFPIAERLGRSTITLPLYPTLTRHQQQYVIKKLKAIVSR